MRDRYGSWFPPTTIRTAKVSTWVWHPGHQLFQPHACALALAHAAVEDFKTLAVKSVTNQDCKDLCDLIGVACNLPDLSRRPVAELIVKLHFGHHVPEHCLHGGGLGDVHCVVHLQELEAEALSHQAAPRGLRRHLRINADETVFLRIL